MIARVSRTQIPLLTTLAVLVVFYTVASCRYTGFFSWGVFVNLLRDNSFLGLAAIGMTFVILGGGIDLSVGAMVGFTSILVARLSENHVHPLLAIALVLALGAGFGGAVGAVIRLAALTTEAQMFDVRAATRSYVLLHVPHAARAQWEAAIEETCHEAKQHGIGIIIAENAGNCDTWEEKVEAVRYIIAASEIEQKRG